MMSIRLFLIPIICMLTIIGPTPCEVQAQADTFITRSREPDVSEETLSGLSLLSAAELAERKIWVYLTDKNIFDTDACAVRLAETALLLNEHAALRRARSRGQALVDYHDIPVHEPYLDELRAQGAEIIHLSRWLNAVSVRASVATLTQVAALPFVRKLTPVQRRLSRRPEPGSPRIPVIPSRSGREVFDYGPSAGQLEEINVPSAHEAGYSGAGVIIAVLDTGYLHTHEVFADLVAAGRLLDMWDFVNNDGEVQDESGDADGEQIHGTSTWSICGGFHEGDLIGPAYGASFLLAKTEMAGEEEPFEEDNWIAGAEWADTNGADIISSSLAYIEWYQYQDMDGNSAVTTIAADIAASRGIVVCTAAGNYGGQDWYFIGAPADADSVITVGAMQESGDMWFNSSHGPTYDGRMKPEVCARGDETYCAIPLGTLHTDPLALYKTSSGTSVSTPLVAGCAALLLEAHPDWTAMQVREALMLTADNAASPDNHRGWGRIDIMAAIGTGTSAPYPSGMNSHAGLQVWPNPTRGETRIVCAPPEGIAGSAILEIYSPNGRRVKVFADVGKVGSLLWDGFDDADSALPSGVYLAVLRAGDWRATGKIILNR
ncbi:MAG: S8 family serine peptidase [bacterium]|nr:S8 family serine peptidase [bacterium]